MADNTKLQYIVELLTQGDTKKATEELKKLQDQGGKADATFAGLSRTMTGLFAVLGGTAFIKQSIDAFLESERAVAKLNAALTVTSQYTPELSQQMRDLADAMAETSLASDEEILNVIARLTAAGAKTKDIEKLTRAVLDLSTLMDRDLNRATQAFALALQGETAALEQVGIQIDKTAGATDRLNQAYTGIVKLAGGQSREAIKGLSGDANQLAKDWDSATEAIGKFFVKLYSIGRSTIGEDLRNLFRTSGARSKDDVIGGKPDYSLKLSPESNAALMKAMEDRIATEKTLDDDLKRNLEQLNEVYEYEDGLIEEINKQHDRSADLRIRRDNEAFENYRNFENMKQDLHDQIVLTVLDGEQRVQAEMEQNHQRRVRMIQDTKFETEEQYMEAMTHEEALYLAEQQRYKQSQTYSYKLKQDMKQVAESGAQAFSSGLATAIVSAFEEGDKAFQKFAANFLRQIAEMILQALILRAVKSAIGLADGGQVTAMANGGMIYAANGVSGVMDVGGPTYFPKFNVLAGEAGREVMTVLARPSFERINGVPAQIGYAGGNRLAITSADALARGGGGVGGRIVLEVRYSKEAEVRLLETSLKNAQVQMVQDAANDTTFSRIMRQKTT